WLWLRLRRSRHVSNMSRQIGDRVLIFGNMRRRDGNLSRQKGFSSALEGDFYRLVAVIVPVMYDQAILVGDIEPPALNESGDEGARLAVPFDPRLDILIGPSADVPLRREPGGEVPEAL